MTTWSVQAICAGTAVPFRGQEKSAFAKTPMEGPLAILSEGLDVDEQADRKHHGGPDMALHLYPADHHAFWNAELGGHELLGTPGAFGTNLVVNSIDEEQVHIGDRFQLGGALIEISQSRQPCWKIEHRFDRKGMVATIIKTGRSGWYFRVLEEGSVQAGDQLERIAIGHREWSVRRAFTTLFGPKASQEDLAALAALERLSVNHRERATKRLS
ncbi:MAG: MOSC domain-containing protein [Erythrobacter sp.]